MLRRLRFNAGASFCCDFLLSSLSAPAGLHHLKRFPTDRYYRNWERVTGNRSQVFVVHPRLRGDKEDLVLWDAAEGVALCRAMGWRVHGEDDTEADAESDETSDEEADVPGGSQEEMKSANNLWISDDFVMRLDRVDSRFFFPIGELARLALHMSKNQSNVLFVNSTLTPVQQRNLEAAMDIVGRAQRFQVDGNESSEGELVSVFDRPRVLLAIFARRATSPVAKLRIEIAEAQQMKAKLGAASMKGISAQLQRVADTLARNIPGCNVSALLAKSGGAGGVSTSFNSSPQKTRQKLQRAFDEKDKQLREESARSEKHRKHQRQARTNIWTIGLVGYTNVGKSAIVNRLSGSDLLVRDGVFVTLDVATRRVLLPSGKYCYVLDSVGFVKDLPNELCDAFAATVEELQVADVVLHVRDMSHPSRDEHFNTVIKVLENAGVDLDRRVLEVWNKRDLLSDREARHFKYIRGKQDSSPIHMVSATNGDGFDELLLGLESKLEGLSTCKSQ